MNLSAYQVHRSTNDLNDDSSQAMEGSQVPEEADTEVQSVSSGSALTFDEGFSLNSSVFQDGSFMIAMPPNLLDSNSSSQGEMTIISSNPSGASIPPPPRASTNFFALSPHPLLTRDSAQSISTTQTEMQSIHAILGDANSKDISVADTENRSPSVPSVSLINVENIPLSGCRSTQDTSEAKQFERDVRTMVDDSKHSQSRMTSCSTASYTHIGLLRDIAQDILPTLSENSRAIPFMPPLPPPINPSPSLDISLEKAPNYKAQDYLPKEFICGICKDVIVGACILNCNCPSSTVCTQCLVDNRLPEIEFASKRCPLCESTAGFKTYCHALDVAILRIIQALPESEGDASRLKQRYILRLSNWRESVLTINESVVRENNIHDDELIARLIEEEERVYWEVRRSRSESKRSTETESDMKENQTMLKKISTVLGKAVIAGTLIVVVPLTIALPLVAVSMRRHSKPSR